MLLILRSVRLVPKPVLFGIPGNVPALTVKRLDMNAYLLQLLNKAKYPFSKCKNRIKRKREQERGNIARKERLNEILVIIALAVVVIVTLAGLIVLFNLLPG